MTKSTGSTTQIIVPIDAGGLFTVRYLRAQGSNRDIGRALAAAAHEVLGHEAGPHRAVDPTVERTRRRWFAMHHPSLSERAAGIADVFGVAPDDEAWDLARLGRVQALPGCSAVFHPGRQTTNGHALLGRNFDFPTATYSEIMGLTPRPGEPPLAADPWVVELHPDHGYATIVVGIMDMMGGMDGINEAGLAISLLADNESPAPEPSVVAQVGLSEQQIVRYVLETCATAQEAKEALLLAKQYYIFAPCHFLIADRSGRSFVWEYSPAHNTEHIVDADISGRMVCTNHLLHRWPDPTNLPDDSASTGTAAFTYRRWQVLNAEAAAAAPVDASETRRQLNAVRFVQPAPGVRTLWQSVYDLHEAELGITFFAGDGPTGSQYTEPFRFALCRDRVDGR